MSDTLRQLVCFGYSHRTASLEAREQLALAPQQQQQFLQASKKSSAIDEAFILSTCNRWEFYAVTRRQTLAEEVLDVLGRINPKQPAGGGGFYQELQGLQCVRHLIEVCSGLDSQLLGETEILGQAKSAYATAEAQQQLGPVLHRLCQKGFQAAKWLRTHTEIGHGQVSLGNVAVSLSSRIFNKLKQRHILVIGSGQVGLDTAKAFLSRGAQHIYLSSRDATKTEALAKEIGAQPVRFEEWPTQARLSDIVVCTTAAPSLILSTQAVTDMMRLRPARPLFIIDLAVPRDVEPTVNELNNVFLYTFADLAEIANENLKARMSEVETCKRIAREKAQYIWQDIEARLNPSPAQPRKRYALPNASASQRPAEASGGVES